MQRARRDPSDLLNNIWLVTEEPDLTPPEGIIYPPEYIERRLREETVLIFKATLPWTVDTEEEALDAVLGVKTQIEAGDEVVITPVDPEAPDTAAEAAAAYDATFDPVVAQAALDAAVAAGAQALRDQLGAGAETMLSGELMDGTVNRVIAEVVAGEAARAVRDQELDRSAIAEMIMEQLPPVEDPIV